MDNRSDHDIIICLEVKMRELKEQFDNHLQHHFRYNVMAWGIALAALIGLIIK